MIERPFHGVWHVCGTVKIDLRRGASRCELAARRSVRVIVADRKPEVGSDGVARAVPLLHAIRCVQRPAKVIAPRRALMCLGRAEYQLGNERRVCLGQLRAR